MRAKTEHINWAMTQCDAEHVSIKAFAEKFNYIDQETAEKAYMALISSTELHKARRQRLQNSFQEFQANSAKAFWTKRSCTNEVGIITTVAAVDSVKAAYRQSKLLYNSHFEVEEGGPSVVSGVDGSSSPTLSPPAHPLFDGTCVDDEQDQADGIDVEVAPRRSLREDHLEDLSCSQDTGHIDLAHFQKLNQQTNWSFGAIDILDRFDQFVRNQGSKEYTLAKDRIADLTLAGEFTAVLSDCEFQAALDGTLEIFDVSNIQQVLKQILSPKNTSVDDMIKLIRSMDHSDDFTYYVSKVFIGWERYFRCQRLEALPNERQTFADLILPALDGAMAMANLALRRFEVTIYGSTTRQNSGRNPFTERRAPGHQADAVVETTESLQLVIVECAKLTDASDEKIAQDHFKIARDMKDTWIEIMRDLVSDNKQPPSNLTVFGVQAFGTELTFLALDFKGCFRLYDLATVRIPSHSQQSGRT
ncbi:hypothetical protein EC968_003793 [Mortierella alpina]|nr:hypothetical protein EC968_003793 [Mortierella alpina]